MKRLILLCTIMFASTLFSQKKYQSLLWEISGNGLQKPSYLYGTMHVSSRVAFHLSDNFFQALHQVDVVALESNPELWLEDYRDKDYNSFFSRYYANIYGGNGFYNNFTLKPIKSEDLAYAFENKYSLINGILYRTHGEVEDFQEDTYLDMFIFQSGKKLGKQVTGLEKVEEQEKLAMKGMMASYAKREVKKSWVDKLLKDKNPRTVTLDAYRNKDLDLIDSIGVGTESEESRKYMLYMRNDNMVHSMDSIMKQKSLFAGIGAAHLPGKNGVIEKLRAKGYTVKPILGPYTDKGKKMKEDIENMVYKTPFYTQTVQDNQFSIPATSDFFPISNYRKRSFISLDIGNGSYLVATRMNTYNFLQKKEHTINLESIDSLFFENIPGKIISKKEISLNGHKGYEIANITDNGDEQRYKIFLTPFEMLAFNIVGKKSYAKEVENSIFPQLKLKPVESGWQDFSPLHGGFSINMPKYYVNYENKKKDNKVEQPEVYAYDPDTDSYFFIIANPIDVLINPEKIDYDLKRMLFEFNNELEIDTLSSDYQEKPYKFATSESILKGDKKLYLKSTVNGNHYYLLGSVTKDTKEKDKFFNSYKPTTFAKYREWKQHKDTVSLFQLKVPVVPPKEVNPYGYMYANDEDEFETDGKKIDSIKYLYKTVYNYLDTGNGAQLMVNYYKDPKYRKIEDLPSFYKHYIKKDLEKFCAYKVDSLGGGIHKNGYQYLDYVIQDTLSDHATQVRYFHKNNKIYELVNAINKVNPIQDDFIDYAYENIEFYENDFDAKALDLEKMYGLDKLPDNEDDDENDFTNDEDFWVTQNEADKELMVNLRKIKSDEYRLKEYITSYQFKPENQEVLLKAIFLLGNVNQKNLPFWKGLYTQYHMNGKIQNEILQAMVKSDKAEGVKVANELLNKDFPAVSASNFEDVIASQWEIEKQEREILPQVLANIQKEGFYSYSIHYFYNLAKEKLLQKKDIKPLKDIMLQNALWQLKHHIDQEKNKDESGESVYYYDYYDEGGNNYEENVKKYVTIFDATKQNEEKQQIINIIRENHNYKMLESFLKDKIDIDLVKTDYDSLYKNPALRKILNKKYKAQFKTNYPKAASFELSTDEILDILKETEGNFDPKKDSIIFKEKFTTKIDKKEFLTYMYEVHFNDEDGDRGTWGKTDKSAAIITFEISEPEKEKKIAKCEALKKKNNKKYYNKNNSSEYNFEEDYSLEMDTTEVIEAEGSDESKDEEIANHILQDNSPYPIVFSDVNISVYDDEDWNEIKQNLLDFLHNKDHEKASFKLFKKKYNNYMYYD